MKKIFFIKMMCLIVIAFTVQACVPMMVANKLLNAPVFSDEDLKKRPNIGIVSLELDKNASIEMVQIKNQYELQTINKLSQYTNVKKIDNFESKGTIFQREVDKLDLLKQPKLTQEIIVEFMLEASRKTEKLYDKQIYNAMKEHNLECIVELGSDITIALSSQRVEFGSKTDIYTLNGEKIVKDSEKKVRAEILWQREKIDSDAHWSVPIAKRTSEDNEKLKAKIFPMIDKQVDLIAKVLFGNR
ncbi:hypothetical protein [Sulfurospirillum sp.]|uniref:hypothetical protein n=1 Tax=Sulfurospirillum sp. TaxID=2053622 RepID=UPI002FDEDC54